MKINAKWIVGLGMLAFCLQLKPCPHGNCPAGRCLADGPKPMGWELFSEEKKGVEVSADSLLSVPADSLSAVKQQEKSHQ